MQIFIDESGIFRQSSSDNAWCSVGAIIIPDSSIAGVSNALRDLKKTLNIPLDEEIKNPRPDSKNSALINFITKLKSLKCTLHVFSAKCSLLDENDIHEHKAGNITGVKIF